MPDAALGTKLSSDACVIAGALGIYSRDAHPLVKRLADLKREAESFHSKVANDHDWRQDEGKVHENNRRRDEIAEVWTQFQDVERDAYAKIVALVGGKPLRVNDGSSADDMYGYDAKALKDSKDLPWGSAVDRDIPWWDLPDQAVEFGKGVIIDGVWGTIKGLGTLVGFDGWDAFKQSWTGLTKLATGLVITAVPFVGMAYWAMPDDKLPSWLRDSRDAMKETGKALVAWDQWKTNPSRAGGAVVFNVLTAMTGGGAAASGAGKAGVAGKALSIAGKVGRAIDPMTYVFKGVGFGISKVGDVMAGLKGITNPKIPEINIDGAFTLPEGAVKMPDGTIHLPKGATIPKGAIKTVDGGIKLPKGTVELPPGTVKLEHGGKVEFMDPHGNVYDEAGNLRQHGDEAPKEDGDHTGKDHAPAKPNSPAPAHAKAPELVGVGGRDGVIKLGSDISDPLHAPDHLTGGGHDLTPGGHAPEGPNASHEPPGGGHGDGPGSTGGHDSGSIGGHEGGSDHPSAEGHGGGSAGGGHDQTTAGRRDDTNGQKPAPPDPLKRPEFMKDGPNPYGEPTSLTKEQIEQIQVYRANEEPGYREQYYDKNGHRKDLSVSDESGYTPPQLAKLAEDAPWTPAKDAPEAPAPRYHDKDYIPLGREHVKDPARLDLLDDFAQKRHDAIEANTLADKLHRAAGLPETKKAYAEAAKTMTKATEAFGEAAAEHHFIAERYPDFEKQKLLGPKNGNDQFDQVWLPKDPKDPRVIVIESKSSVDTDLGKRNLPSPRNIPGVKGAAVSQGSREYFFDILREMYKRGETELADKIDAALANGDLEYYVVKGEKNTGSYTGLQHRQFDIRKGTLPGTSEGNLP
ncbi:hypothetical protein ACWCXH_27115 [Kitasatospora sp. NPDC001660]